MLKSFFNKAPTDDKGGASYHQASHHENGSDGRDLESGHTATAAEGKNDEEVAEEKKHDEEGNLIRPGETRIGEDADEVGEEQPQVKQSNRTGKSDVKYKKSKKLKKTATKASKNYLKHVKDGSKFKDWQRRDIIAVIIAKNVELRSEDRLDTEALRLLAETLYHKDHTPPSKPQPLAIFTMVEQRVAARRIQNSWIVYQAGKRYRAEEEEVAAFNSQLQDYDADDVLGDGLGAAELFMMSGGHEVLVGDEIQDIEQGPENEPEMTAEEAAELELQLNTMANATELPNEGAEEEGEGGAAAGGTVTRGVAREKSSQQQPMILSFYQQRQLSRMRSSLNNHHNHNHPGVIPTQQPKRNILDIPWVEANLVKARNYSNYVQPRKGGKGGIKFPYYHTTTGRHCCLGSCGEQFDLWEEGQISEFSLYGPGVTNYFKFMKWAFWLFCLLTIAALPLMVLNMTGQNSTSGLTAIGQTTIGNLASINNALLYNISNIIYYNVTINSNYDAIHIHIPGCSPEGITKENCYLNGTHLALFYAIIDIIISIIIFLAYLWLVVFQSVEVKELDKNTILASQYTIMVTHFAPDTTEDDLTNHFNALLAGPKIVGLSHYQQAQAHRQQGQGQQAGGGTTQQTGRQGPTQAVTQQTTRQVGQTANAHQPAEHASLTTPPAVQQTKSAVLDVAFAYDNEREISLAKARGDIIRAKVRLVHDHRYKVTEIRHQFKLAIYRKQQRAAWKAAGTTQAIVEREERKKAAEKAARLKKRAAEKAAKIKAEKVAMAKERARREKEVEELYQKRKKERKLTKNNKGKDKKDKDDKNSNNSKDKKKPGAVTIAAPSAPLAELTGTAAADQQLNRLEEGTLLAAPLAASSSLTVVTQQPTSASGHQPLPQQEEPEEEEDGPTLADHLNALILTEEETNTLQKKIDKEREIFFRTMKHLNEDLKTKDAKLESMAKRDNPLPIAAYVTFNYISDAKLALEKYHHVTFIGWITGGFGLTLKGYKLKVKAAPEPSVIIWENMPFNYAMRFSRKVITFFLSLLLITITLAMIFSSKYLQEKTLNSGSNSSSEKDSTVSLCPDNFHTDFTIAQQEEIVTKDFPQLLHCYCEALATGGSSDAIASLKDASKNTLCEHYFITQVQAQTLQYFASFMIVIVNTLIEQVVDFSSKYEKHHTSDGMSLSMFSRLFVLKVINSGAVFLINNNPTILKTVFGVVPANSAVEFTADWYNTIAVTIVLVQLGEIVSNRLYSLYIYYSLENEKSKVARGLRKGLTQDELNKLHVGPQFEFAYYYAQMMVTFFVCLTFSTGIPVLYPIAAANFLLFYCLEKYLFIHCYQIPPHFTTKVGERATNLIPLGLLLHLAMSIWVLSNNELFVGAAASQDNAASVTSSVFGATIKEKITGRATFPLFMTFVTIIGLHLLYFLYKQTKFTLHRMYDFLFGCISERHREKHINEEKDRSWRLKISFTRAVQRNLIKGLATYNILQNPVYKEAFGITWKFAVENKGVRAVRYMKAKAQQDENEDDAEKVEELNRATISHATEADNANGTNNSPSTRRAAPMPYGLTRLRSKQDTLNRNRSFFGAITEGETMMATATSELAHKRQQSQQQIQHDGSKVDDDAEEEATEEEEERIREDARRQAQQHKKAQQALSVTTPRPGGASNASSSGVSSPLPSSSPSVTVSAPPGSTLTISTASGTSTTVVLGEGGGVTTTTKAAASAKTSGKSNNSTNSANNSPRPTSGTFTLPSYLQFGNSSSKGSSAANKSGKPATAAATTNLARKPSVNSPEMTQSQLQQQKQAAAAKGNKDQQSNKKAAITSSTTTTAAAAPATQPKVHRL